MNIVWKILATFFGSGYFPLAPGTFASLIILFIYKYYLSSLSWPVYISLVVILFFIGVIASNRYSEELGEKDPQKIVIDEVCGQLLVFTQLPASWIPLFIGFFLFRFFDIIKPYPIKRAEDLQKGWGIMADDAAAGVYAAVILRIYLLF